MKKDFYGLISEHEGKMAGIGSISTSSLLNCNCKKRCCLNNAICSKCFSNFYQGFRKQLREKLARNTELLTTRLLTKLEIQNLCISSLFFRFEAFGDLINSIQFKNYCNIARFFKNTKFAIWTKNPHVIVEYVKKGGRIPKNLTIGLSSLFINSRMNEKSIAYFEKFFHVDFVFTVFNEKYINENNININCGSKNCLNCHFCYCHHKQTAYVNEKLK